MLEDLKEKKTIPLVVGDEISILAKKLPKGKKQIPTENLEGGKGASLTPLEDSQSEEEKPQLPIKRPKGRPRKPVDKEAEQFKKRVAEETEKAYKEVIETKIKSKY